MIQLVAFTVTIQINLFMIRAGYYLGEAISTLILEFKIQTRHQQLHTLYLYQIFTSQSYSVRSWAPPYPQLVPLLSFL